MQSGAKNDTIITGKAPPKKSNKRRKAKGEKNTMRKSFHFEADNLKPTAHTIKSAYRAAQAILQADKAQDYTPAITPPHTMEAAETTYNILLHDAYNVVSFLYAQQPSDILNQIRADLASIKPAQGNIYAAIVADEADERAEEARDDTASYTRMAKRISTAENDRAELLELATERATDARKAAEERDNANTAHARTLAADMLHAGYIAAYTRPKAAEIDRAAETIGEDATAAEILTQAERAHRRAAMRAWIRGQAHGVNALDGTNIKYTPADADTVKAWRDKYGASADEPQPTKGGTKALIYQDTATKTRPAGYYIKYTSKTFRRASSFDVISADGLESIATSANQFIESQGGAERLEALYNAADLSPRERAYLQAFCSRAAREEGGRARTAYITTKGAKATTSGAERAETNARHEYAAHRIGLQSQRTGERMRGDIAKALKAAHKAAEKNIKAARNAAPLFEQDYNFFNALTRNNRGIRYTEPAAPCGMSKTYTFGHYRNPYAPAIKWTEGEKPQAVSRAELEQIQEQERAAASVRVFAQFVRDNVPHGIEQLNRISADNLTNAAQIWRHQHADFLKAAEAVERNKRHTLPASASREEQAVFTAKREAVRRAAATEKELEISLATHLLNA